MPDLRTLKKGKLTNEMNNILFEHTDDVLMTAEVHEVWEGFNEEGESLRNSNI